MSRSNQGRELSRLLDDLAVADLSLASLTTWHEMRRHGPEASCECPLLEGLAHLYDLGYRLVKDGPDDVQIHFTDPPRQQEVIVPVRGRCRRCGA